MLLFLLRGHVRSYANALGFDLILYVPSTIFQLCRDGANAVGVKSTLTTLCQQFSSDYCLQNYLLLLLLFQNKRTVLKQLKRFTKISGSSDATKFWCEVTLIFLQCASNVCAVSSHSFFL